MGKDEAGAMSDEPDIDERVAAYVDKHPGVDAVDIAEALGIGLCEAADATRRLLAAGRLDFHVEEARGDVGA